jgi:hypothetical protein
MATGAYGPILPVDAETFESGTRQYEQSASFTGKRGTPVVIDGNGRIDEAASTFTSVFGISANTGANTGAGVDKLIVFPIRKGSKWEITLDGVLALTDLKEAVGLAADSTTGYWYASTADTGAQAYVVDYVKGPGGYEIGDTKARVIIEFKDSVLQTA